MGVCVCAGLQQHDGRERGRVGVRGGLNIQKKMINKTPGSNVLVLRGEENNFGGHPGIRWTNGWTAEGMRGQTCDAINVDGRV